MSLYQKTMIHSKTGIFFTPFPCQHTPRTRSTHRRECTFRIISNKLFYTWETFVLFGVGWRRLRINVRRTGWSGAHSAAFAMRTAAMHVECNCFGIVNACLFFQIHLLLQIIIVLYANHLPQPTRQWRVDWNSQ